MLALAYVGAALAEIAGCFALWAWLRLDKSPLWIIPGVLAADKRAGSVCPVQQLKSPDITKAIDDGRRQQYDIPTRSEAIRRPVDKGCGAVTDQAESRTWRSVRDRRTR